MSVSTSIRTSASRAATALFLAATALLAGCATSTTAARSCWHRNAKVEQEIGYCQVLRIGSALHVSGVTAAGPMETAVPRVYERLREILAAQGLGFEHVVKETVYATDLDAFIAQKDKRLAYYGQTWPAGTWVQVQRLYLPAFVVEVELIVHDPR